MQKREQDVMADNRGLLKQTLLRGGQRIDTRGKDGLNRRRNLMAHERLGQVIVAARSLDHSGIDERAHDFFDKERISTGPLHQKVS